MPSSLTVEESPPLAAEFFKNSAAPFKKLAVWDLRSCFETLCIGGLCYSGSAGLFFVACQLIGTGLAMVIFFSYPAFIFLLSWKLDRLPITKPIWIALVTLILGMFLLSGSLGDLSLDWRGVAFSLISAISYATYVYLSKKRASQLSTLTSTWLVCLGSALMFLAISGMDQTWTFPNSAVTWGHVLGIALICTAFPILFLLEGLKTTDAGQAAVLSVLEPVVTVLIGAALLNEKMSFFQEVGVAIVLGSAIWIQFEKSKKPRTIGTIYS